MNQQIFRIVYCSRNLIEGSAADVTASIRHILQRSRANNAGVDVTGALIYNSGMFAQVLEGPVDAVGKIFEKIQHDLRHGEVIVIETGVAQKRQFADWSMAFSSGGAPDPAQRAVAAFDAAFSHAADAGEQMLAVLRELVHQEDDWAVPDAA